MAEANHSRNRYGHAADGAPVGLREGVPEVPTLRSRELEVLGAIEVAHHWLLPGEIELLPFKGHLVNLHLSAPHHLVQKRNEHTHEALEVTRAVDVLPADTPAYFRMGAASEDMSMLLEDRFIRRVAREAGVADPDKVEIVPFFSAPDPQVERIGLSLLSEMGTGGLGGELYAESLANVLALHLLRHHSSLGRGSRRKTEQREGGFSRRALVQGPYRALALPVRHPPARRPGENPALRHRPEHRRGRPGGGLRQPEPPRLPLQTPGWRLPQSPSPKRLALAPSYFSRKEQDPVQRSKNLIDGAFDLWNYRVEGCVGRDLQERSR